MHTWLSVLVDIALPLAAGVGLLFMIFAHTDRKMRPNLEEAYGWMRAAALSFALALLLLWLRWRGLL